MTRALGALRFDGLCAIHPLPWTDRPPSDPPLAGWEPAQFVAGCPVVPRIPLSSSAADIALTALLDQPLVLYGHHEDVAEGLEPLAEAAAMVNRLGDARWMSVGEIAATNYAVRVTGSSAGDPPVRPARARRAPAGGHVADRGGATRRNRRRGPRRLGVRVRRADARSPRRRSRARARWRSGCSAAATSKSTMCRRRPGVRGRSCVGPPPRRATARCPSAPPAPAEPPFARSAPRRAFCLYAATRGRSAYE